MLGTLRRVLIGKRLATQAIVHEHYTNPQAFGVFGGDPKSSTVYATEAILLVLITAGPGASVIALPIAAAICAVIAILVLSYRQMVFAYPQGGGVYNVARANLGPKSALVGAATLLVDYVLTVDVSVSAGVSAIVSAIPSLDQSRVMVAIFLIVGITLINLRGVRESGWLFSIPTYFFIGTLLMLFGYGAWRLVSGTFPAPLPSHSIQATGSLGVLLILRAFASGCTALTGLEAISNGVPAFRQPQSENAAKTLTWIGCTLGAFFLGITVFAYLGGVLPPEGVGRHGGGVGETVVSQIARMLFGGGFFYSLVIAAAVIILLLAANTPFAGFPRVASQLAKDYYFPRQFLNLGSKLVFANGIIVLGIVASVVVWLFGAREHNLIPLYAVGVFLVFTLGQLGMIKHWRRIERIKGVSHRKEIAISVAGCATTVLVLLVVFVSKFADGAWMLLVGIPLLVWGMRGIHAHYRMMERALSLKNVSNERLRSRTYLIMVSAVNSATMYTVERVKFLARPDDHVIACHIFIDEDEGRLVREQWEQRVPDIPMETVYAKDRNISGAVVDYLKDVDDRWPDDLLMVKMTETEVMPPKLWHQFLHNQTGKRLGVQIQFDSRINPEISVESYKVRDRSCHSVLYELLRESWEDLREMTRNIQCWSGWQRLQSFLRVYYGS